MSNQKVEQAYQYCLNLAQSHYENFPVASGLLPKRIRRSVSVIYAYARTADDYADEGNLSAEERVQQLNEMETKIQSIYSGEDPDEILYIAVQDVIRKYDLPSEPFLDLLTAFRLDVTKTRFQDFDEIINYCHYSANPVGRLLLYLYKSATPYNFEYSDAICSALQLINFLQDIHQDYHENNRIYLPLDEMSRHSITENDIKESNNSPDMRAFIDTQILRAEKMLLSGLPLGNILKGRIGLELRAITYGGLRILHKLRNKRDDVYARPRLNKLDWIWVISHAILGSLK